jgi:hypothetical protein
LSSAKSLAPCIPRCVNPEGQQYARHDRKHLADDTT